MKERGTASGWCEDGWRVGDERLRSNCEKELIKPGEGFTHRDTVRRQCGRRRKASAQRHLLRSRPACASVQGVPSSAQLSGPGAHCVSSCWIRMEREGMTGARCSSLVTGKCYSSRDVSSGSVFAPQCCSHPAVTSIYVQHRDSRTPDISFPHHTVLSCPDKPPRS